MIPTPSFSHHLKALGAKFKSASNRAAPCSTTFAHLINSRTSLQRHKKRPQITSNGYSFHQIWVDWLVVTWCYLYLLSRAWCLNFCYFRMIWSILSPEVLIHQMCFLHSLWFWIDPLNCPLKNQFLPEAHQIDYSSVSMILTLFLRGRIDIEATLRLMVALTQKVYFF